MTVEVCSPSLWFSSASASGLSFKGSTANDGICLNCPAGFAKNTISVEPCTKCLAGQYSDSLLDCKPCAVGKFTNTDAQNECASCISGQYQDEEGSVDCKSCGPGKFAASAETSCSECEGGKYQILTQAILYSCNPCGKGRFSVNSQTSCSDCEIGKYQGQETATEWVCKPCGLGKIATSASASLCSNCEVGRFQDFTTAASHTCKICSIGMYSASATTTEGCVVCPAGFIQKIPGPEFYGCTKCAPGKINDDTGTGKSVNCVSFWFFLLSFFPMLDNLI